MAKLPIKLKEELEKIQEESSPAIAQWISRIKADCPNLPSWISEKGAEYYEGLLQGNYMMIERSLSIYNCYHGYMEKTEEIHIGSRTFTIQYNSYCF